MLAKSNPPITSTPITPFLDEHAFRSESPHDRLMAELICAEHAICLDGSKAKRILGFKPSKPRIEADELRRIVKGFQDDALW